MPTTHFKNGFTNVAKEHPWGGMTIPDPVKAVVYNQDFVTDLDWTAGTPISHTRTVVQDGAGSATFASANGKGGLVLITNDAADDDSVSIQSKAEFFKHDSSTKPWSLVTRLKISDATQSDLLVGLAITDTTPLDATDRIAWEKADGSTTCSLKLTKDSTSTTVASTTLANDTFVVLGACYNPQTREVEAWVDGVKVGSTSTLTNLCDDEDLAATFHIQNGEAVAKTATVDYLVIAQER